MRKGGHRGPFEKVWKVVGYAEEMRFPQLEHDCTWKVVYIADFKESRRERV